MPDTPKPLAIVTGASTGIGYELAKLCAQNGYDLLIAADQAAIHDAAKEFQALGATVEAVEVDLATIEGVDKLYAAAEGRGRSMRCSPMPGTASGMPSSTRTSPRCAM